jgi:MFS family permease
MFLMSCAVLVIAPMIPSIQESRGFPVASLGIIAGVTLLVGVAAELFLGPQADRGYERPLLIGSVVVAAVSLIGSGAADSVVLLTMWRALAGVAYGMFVPAASAIVIRSSPQGVGERLARLQVAEYAGFAAGPFLGALLLAQIGSTHGLELAGLVSLALIPVVMSVQVPRRVAVSAAPEPDAATPPEAASGGDAVPPPRPSGLAFSLLRHRAVWVALILSVAVTAPVGTYAAMWSRFLADRGATGFVIAVSLGLFTLPFLIIAPIAGRFVDRVGPLRGAVWGTVIVAFVVFAYGVIGSLVLIIAVSLVESAGQALAGPGTAAAMARAAGPERAGAGQGLSRGFGFLAAGLTSFAAGPVYADWGARALFGATAAMMIVLAVVGWFAALRWAPEFDDPLDVEPAVGEYVTTPAE